MPVSADEKFVTLARKMRFLTADQIDGLRRRQQEVAGVGARLTFAEIAQSDMLLTAEQVNKVLLASEYTDLLEEEKRIGALAVERGLASDEEITVCLDTQKYEFASQRKMPRRLTDIMIEAEILTPESVAVLKAEDEKRRARVLAKPPTPVPGKMEAEGRPGSSAKMVAERPGSAAEIASARPGSSSRLKAAYPEGPTVPYDTDVIARLEQGAPSRPAGDRPAGRETPARGAPAVADGPPPGKPGPEGGATRRISARVILESADGLDAAFPLTSPLTIGRQPGCQIRLDDSRASREHSRVEYDTQLRHHIVTDLGSRNGTIVNGVRITAPTVLKPGDKIRIGDAVLRYEV